MRVKAPQRRSAPDPWPTSSILGPTSRRLGTALVAIGALWMGVLWVILTPPREAGLASASSPKVAGQAQTPQPQAPAPVPQRVGLRALAMADEPAGLNGSFDRFGLQLLTMVLASNNRGETAFYATIRRSQSEEGVFLDSRGDVAFVAWVRHGRDTIEVIYVARKVGAVHQLTKVAASGEPAPGGGFFAGFGAPVVNNGGAVAFPAVVKLGPALGAIFVAPAEAPMHLFLGTGDPAPTGGVFARFSERIGVDDAGGGAFRA